MYGTKTVRQMRACDGRTRKKKKSSEQLILRKLFLHDELFGELLVAELAG